VGFGYEKLIGVRIQLTVDFWSPYPRSGWLLRLPHTGVPEIVSPQSPPLRWWW
jgi:hypothetical protein